MTTHRKPYDTDINDAEWAFVAPYLISCTSTPASNVTTSVRSSTPSAGCFEAIVHDLRKMLRLVEGREANPTAAIIDSRTVQSTCESGPRAGYDGYKRCKGEKGTFYFYLDGPPFSPSLHPCHAPFAAMRHCVARGRPYGSDAWASRTAEVLGLESSLRPRGRPRNVESPPTLQNVRTYVQI
jgi:hypothetical protein